MRKFLALGEPFAEITLSYLEHGRPGGRPIVCVHGLTRNAHDFDELATALAEQGRHVLAVDVVGRGRSSWLGDPADYRIETYAAHLWRLLERLGLDEVDWVGTSMGGLIGMLVAAREGSPIRRLVLNDIGPFVHETATAGIRAYLGLDLLFPTLDALEAHLRQIHAGFGRLTDAQWGALARHGSRETPEGWRLSYDPAIRAPFVAEAADVHLWEVWDRITCPAFVLRGAESGILTAATLDEMARRGPPVEAVTLPDVGHAPALNTPEQIAIVARWLA